MTDSLEKRVSLGVADFCKYTGCVSGTASGVVLYGSPLDEQALFGVCFGLFAYGVSRMVEYSQSLGAEIVDEG